MAILRPFSFKNLYKLSYNYNIDETTGKIVQLMLLS